jgi:hypothetical protein
MFICFSRSCGLFFGETNIVMIIDYKGINVNLNKASEMTCICFKEDGTPFIWGDMEDFTDFPQEHIEQYDKHTPATP